ncbi:MAG TPA: DUF779 domain-containing protein [Thermoplasmata archaeon]|nr:DUF779 domain-containing protein [Thermoplasmata archaeon]
MNVPERDRGAAPAAPVPRVAATSRARAALAELRRTVGPVALFQSGGCCDGSLPLCFPDGEIELGPNDLRLGSVDGTPVYLDRRLLAVWGSSQWILDVADGAPEGFSLAAGPEAHFVARARIVAAGAFPDLERAAAAP